MEPTDITGTEKGAANIAAAASKGAGEAPPAASPQPLEGQGVQAPPQDGGTAQLPPAAGGQPEGQQLPGQPQQPVESQAPKPVWQELGFKNEGELAEAYRNLNTLRGKLGTEVGTLRQQMADLQAKAQQQAVQPQANQVPEYDRLLADAQKKLDDGEISHSEYLKTATDAAAMRAKAEAETIINQRLTEAAQQQRAEAERVAYAQQFMSENPDFEAFYNAGKLDAFIARGVSAEQAYFQVKVNEQKQQLEQLQQQLQTGIQNAQTAGQQDGFQRATQLRNGAKAAGTVLGQHGGGGPSFAGSPQFQAGLNKHQRNNFGRQFLERLRSGR